MTQATPVPIIVYRQDKSAAGQARNEAVLSEGIAFDASDLCGRHGAAGAAHRSFHDMFYTERPGDFRDRQVAALEVEG